MTTVEADMLICDDESSSSSDFMFSAITAGLNGHDSISFRRALKKNHAKYGLY